MTTALAPKDAIKHYRQGLDDYRKKNSTHALTEFRTAVQLYPKLATAWVAIAHIEISQGKAEAARESIANALKADANFGGAQILRAELAWQARDWKELAESSERAIQFGAAAHPRVLFYQAVAQFGLNDLEAAERAWKKAGTVDLNNEIPLIHQYLATVLAKNEEGRIRLTSILGPKSINTARQSFAPFAIVNPDPRNSSVGGSFAFWTIRLHQ